MRAIRSCAFFEQMKGRGVRVIKPDDLQSVTPDARAKDHFVIVDAIGVCEQDKTDSRPIAHRKRFRGADRTRAKMLAQHI